MRAAINKNINLKALEISYDLPYFLAIGHTSILISSLRLLIFSSFAIKTKIIIMSRLRIDRRKKVGFI